MLVACWTPVPVEDLTRSSHAVAVVANRAYIFGGELVPRIPLPAELIVLDLSTHAKTIIPPSAETPLARVGTSLVAVGTDLYLWGGRGGKEMGTFDGDVEDLWRFDTTSSSWSRLTTGGADKPVQRSFHTMTAVGTTLFLHAGCPAKGRLGTLHSLDLAATPLIWKALPDAPGPGRGGTVLCPLRNSSTLVRFGGFAGFELGGPLDTYDLATNEWQSSEIQVEGGKDLPEKRSVHALIGLEGSLAYEGKKVVAVMVHGEREGAPAELGHDGAGFFHSDVWALVASSSTPATFSWLRLPLSTSSATPQARGWFASAFVQGDTVLVQGGLNERNERLGDAFTLEVLLE